MTIKTTKPYHRRSRGDRIISRSCVNFDQYSRILKEIHKWVVVSNEFDQTTNLFNSFLKDEAP